MLSGFHYVDSQNSAGQAFAELFISWHLRTFRRVRLRENPERVAQTSMSSWHCDLSDGWPPISLLLNAIS